MSWRTTRRRTARLRRRTCDGIADSTCEISPNVSPGLREQFNHAVNLQVTPDFSPQLNSDFTAEFSLALNSQVTSGFRPALRHEFSLRFILGPMAKLNPDVISELTAKLSPAVTSRFTAKFNPRFNPGFNPGVTLHFPPQVPQLAL